MLAAACVPPAAAADGAEPDQLGPRRHTAVMFHAPPDIKFDRGDDGKGGTPWRVVAAAAAEHGAGRVGTHDVPRGTSCDVAARAPPRGRYDGRRGAADIVWWVGEQTRTPLSAALTMWQRAQIMLERFGRRLLAVAEG
eukprot:gene26649-50501_t